MVMKNAPFPLTDWACKSGSLAMGAQLLHVCGLLEPRFYVRKGGYRTINADALQAAIREQYPKLLMVHAVRIYLDAAGIRLAREIDQCTAENLQDDDFDKQLLDAFVDDLFPDNEEEGRRKLEGWLKTHYAQLHRSMSAADRVVRSHGTLPYQTGKPSITDAFELLEQGCLLWLFVNPVFDDVHGPLADSVLLYGGSITKGAKVFRISDAGGELITVDAFELAEKYDLVSLMAFLPPRH